MTTQTKSRVISARIEHGQVILSDNTYPIRADIRTNGFIYHSVDETWRAAASPVNIAYARSIAQGLESYQPADPAAAAASATDAATASATDAMYADQLADDPTRRRVKRTADPAPAQTQQTDIAAALAAFVASIAPTQHAPTQAPVDLSQIADMINAALEPIRQALADRPSTSLTVTQGDQTRTVDGLQHHMLHTFIRCLSAGLHVWLAGPSGSGKTHGAEQAAHALGLAFRLQGAMTMAHELTGFVDASGKYHETPFVTTFRDGGLILLDELDAGSNEALLALNAALANGVMCLPSGEIIRAHADFKCVGAANTFGQGATADYVGRTRIDAAFLQRFGARLTWGYDEQLETAMANLPTWSARVQRARQMAKAAGLKVLITPRASVAGAKLIRAGFSPDEAADLTYRADLSPDQRRSVD
jgi:cobaltochelatase CobS